MTPPAILNPKYMTHCVELSWTLERDIIRSFYGASQVDIYQKLVLFDFGWLYIHSWFAKFELEIARSERIGLSVVSKSSFQTVACCKRFARVFYFINQLIVIKW